MNLKCVGDNVDEYVVKVEGGNSSVITVKVSGNMTSALVTGLTERTDYNVTVCASRDNVTSTTSPISSFRTRADGKCRLLLDFPKLSL